MEERNVYQDISRRTDGDVYIGVARSRQNGKINIYKKVYGFACSAQYP